MSKQDLKHIIHTITNNQAQQIGLGGKIKNSCVALILRWRPYNVDQIQYTIPSSASDFLNQSWVNDCHGEAEIMYLKRAVRPGDYWSGHVGFPGGKCDPHIDKTNLDTVIRECREEVGLDLSSPSFTLLGTLSPILILQRNYDYTLTVVPHIFLQIVPTTPPVIVRLKEVTETFWTPIKYLLQDPIIPYSPLSDIVIQPGKKLPWVPEATHVAGIQVKNATGDKRHLWGITLKMTQESLGMLLSSHIYLSTEELEDLLAMKRSKL